MLALLVVGDPPGPAEALETDSSLEILHARDADEAVEKLGRNRRIDGVLILSPDDAGPSVAAIREDILAPPPIFLPEDAPETPGARRLAAREPAALIALARQHLEG